MNNDNSILAQIETNTKKPPHAEALLLLAGVCENRTHLGRDRRPATSFED